MAEAIKRRFIVVNCEQKYLRMQVSIPESQVPSTPFIYAEESMSEEL